MNLKNTYQNHLKMSWIYALLSIIFIYPIPVFAFLFGILGFFRAKKAVKDGHHIAIIPALINTLVILYFLLIVFVLGYVFTSH